MEKSWKNKATDGLLEAICALKDKNEARKFLRDLLTAQEIIEFGKRWQAARMLSKNRPYSEIEKETGLSSTTIARVAKWLKKGMGGYRLMIKRLNISRNHHQPFSFGKGLG